MFTDQQIAAMLDRLPPGPSQSRYLLAVVFETVKAINELRELHGLSKRTKTQVINAIVSRASALHMAEDDE